MKDTAFAAMNYFRRRNPPAADFLGICRGSSLAAAILFCAVAAALAGCSQDKTHAQSEAPPPLAYLGSWGVKGDGPGQLDQPTCMATDAMGYVYIADAGSHFVDKFDSRGTPLLSYQDEKLKQPESIAVDAGGAVYVTDASRQSAFVYLPNGDRYRQIRVRTRPNSEENLSVAVDDDGLIHILDADAGRIFVYTPRFRLVRNWQPAAKTPGGKARVQAVATNSDGDLYLADPGENRILRFTHEGRFVAAIGSAGDGVEPKLSSQFAVAGNYLFVMDANGRMLHVWSTDGRPKLDVDLAPELGQGNRRAPALAVSTRKELFVLDAPGARVLRYHINF